MRLSRRDFLKLGGVALLGLGVREWPLLKDLWKKNGMLVTGEIGDIDDIVDKIPKQLESRKIPENNEWFRSAERIFKEGIEIFEKWNAEEGSDLKPRYDQPNNYINVDTSIKWLVDNANNIRQKHEEVGSDWFKTIGPYLSEDFDRPYQMIIKGSQSSISNLQQMIEVDPGTGFVRTLKEKMKIQYGDDFDIWDACRNGLLSVGQREYMKSCFDDWYVNVMDFLQKARDKSDEPVSSNVLFAYFLHNNHGDILASAWDTATLLKIMARNDPTDDLKFDPNFERAKLVTTLIRDEFSPHISANWVVDNVDPNDELLNYVENNYNHPEYKTYMPPNRAGLYHDWVIIALSMCMTPQLLKRMVATHLRPYYLPSGVVVSEYGRERTLSDMLVVDKVDEISKIAKLYEE